MREHHKRIGGCEVVRYEDGDGEWTLVDAPEFTDFIHEEDIEIVVVPRRIRSLYDSGGADTCALLERYAGIKQGERLPDWLEAWLTGYFDEETREDEFGVTLEFAEFSEPCEEVER